MYPRLAKKENNMQQEADMLFLFHSQMIRYDDDDILTNITWFLSATGHFFSFSKIIPFPVQELFFIDEKMDKSWVKNQKEHTKLIAVLVFVFFINGKINTFPLTCLPLTEARQVVNRMWKDAWNYGHKRALDTRVKW